jgi:hypothetical protein
MEEILLGPAFGTRPELAEPVLTRIFQPFATGVAVTVFNSVDLVYAADAKTALSKKVH